MRKSTLRLFSAGFFVSFASNFGLFNLVIFNNPVLAIRHFIFVGVNESYHVVLSTTTVSVMYGMANGICYVGYLIATFVAPFLLDGIGRKYSLVTGSAIQIVGDIFLTLSGFYLVVPLMFVARFIQGFTISLMLIAAQSFNTEIAPPESRGLLASGEMPAWAIASVLAAACGSPSVLGTTHLWFYLPLIPLFVSCISIIVFVILPDSPRFLMLNKQDVDLALRSIEYFQGADKIIEASNEIDTERVQSDQRRFQIVDVWTTPYRNGFLIGFVLMTAAHLTGMICIMSYSTPIMLANGYNEYDSALVTIVMTIFSVVCAFATMPLYKLPRRICVIGGTTMLLVADFIMIVGSALAVAYRSKVAGGFTALGLVLFGSAIVFSVPIIWLAVSELADQRSKATMMSVLALLVGICETLSFMFFTVVMEKVGAAVAILPFFIVAFPTPFIMFYYFPETKDKSIYDIMLALGYTDDDIGETLSIVSRSEPESRIY